MLNSVESEEDSKLLTYWFVKDENCVPPLYLLQPIRTKLTHYADNSDADSKKKVINDYDVVYESF